MFHWKTGGLHLRFDIELSDPTKSNGPDVTAKAPVNA
jgi:hypothetical protein